jgi:hypothetical protein
MLERAREVCGCVLLYVPVVYGAEAVDGLQPAALPRGLLVIAVLTAGAAVSLVVAALGLVGGGGGGDRGRVRGRGRARLWLWLWLNLRLQWKRRLQSSY